MPDPNCIVIGASHAAGQVISSLRQEGWSGGIILIGEEDYLPYNRPPLSKTFLAAETTPEQLLIRSRESYEKAGVDCRLGTRAAAIRPEASQVELGDGDILSYDKLVLTLGSRVRTVDLPGSGLAGVCYLRDIRDVRRIQPFAAPGKRVVIVGGGYIGLEAAAMLRKLKMDVTVLEMGPRVLARVTAPEVSAFYTRIHGEEGVRIVTDAAVSGFGGDTAIQEVLCQDGSRYAADLVIIGIGVLPNMELAQEAGLEVENGIVVDAHCVTSDPDIAAAGDCTWFYHPFYGRHMRLESVQNAVDQARVAAAAVCGNPKEYNALPWFWSDQYDLKLQIAGLSQGYDEVIVRGDFEGSRKFAAFYLQDGVVIAVDAINSPQEFLMGKRIITGKMPVDKSRLADASVPMKELLIK